MSKRIIKIVAMTLCLATQAQANFDSVFTAIIAPLAQRCPGFLDGDAQIRVRSGGYHVWDGGRHNYWYECYLPATANKTADVVILNGLEKTGDGANSPSSPNEPNNNEMQCPGSIVLVDSRTLGEKINIAGAPFNLVYFSNKAEGRYAESSVSIPVFESNPAVTAISIEGTYADGQTFGATYPNNPDQRYNFIWNNRDSAGNLVYESQDLQFKVTYSAYGKQIPVEYVKSIGGWKSAYMKIGGWQPDSYHYYDAKRSFLVKGDGQNKYRRYNYFEGEYFVASDDVSEIYVFDYSGKHLRTVNGLTGAIKFNFQHSGNLLTAIVDDFGQTTTFQRNSAGYVTSIVSPKGQVTDLSYSKSNFLTKVTNPLGESYSMTYRGISGLLATFQKPEGELSKFSYDSLGLLTKDEHSGGVTSALSQEFDSTWYSIKRVILETATGKKFIREVTNSGADSNSVSRSGYSELNSRRSPKESMDYQLNGEVYSQAGFRKDQRFNDVNYRGRSTFSYFGAALSQDVHKNYTLANPTNPFSVTSYVRTLKTENKSSVLSYNGVTGDWVNTSFEQRPSYFTTNPQGQVLKGQVANFAPTIFEYFADSRLKSTRQADKKVEMTYDTYGYLKSVIDPLGRKTDYSFDSVGKLKSQVLLDGRKVSYAYDKNGRLTEMTLPHGKKHRFVYNEMELLAQYQPPELNGTNTATKYQYNLDNTLSKVTLPDNREINYVYDSTVNRPNRIYSNDTDRYFAYGNFPRNTPLQIWKSNWFAAAGYRQERSYFTETKLSQETIVEYPEILHSIIKYNFDSLFRVSTVELTDHSNVKSELVRYVYDKDDLITQAGSLEVRRDPLSGLVTSKKLFNAEVKYFYDSKYGELQKISYYYFGRDVYTREYKRDLLGRIVEENDGQPKTIFYDRAGRLLGRSDKASGRPFSSYQYDKNGNRILSEENGVTQSATYDDQDRLLSFGTNTYSYNANGNISSKVDGSLRLTNYIYDSDGTLAAVNMPEKNVEYGTDHEGRRIEKKINGVKLENYIWDGLLRLVAITNASGVIQKKFIYSDGHVPDYMVDAQGNTYLFVTDHRGSVVGVLNANNGQIAQSLEYTEWGAIVSDSNPGFQPFGFAGGLYDRDTGLVRFGARDYDPEIGRWTSKDPILFGGGDTNLYGYTFSDPVNFIDPSGLSCQYSQGSGSMSCTNGSGQQYYNQIGYSGASGGKNNSSMQSHANIGPIPQGTYTAGSPRPGGHMGPNAIPLVPDFLTGISISMMGRDPNSFYMHGNNATNDASSGCIILPPNRTNISPGEVINVGQ